MALDFYLPNLPVLLLFNLDLSWSPEEQDEVFAVTSQLDNALSALGYRTTQLPVTDKDLENLLGQYDPLEYIVFNWCEYLPGLTHSEYLVAQFLEEHNYAFTGAGSDAIAFAQDKPRVKRLLEKAGIPTPAWRLFPRNAPIAWESFPAIVKASQEHCSEGIDRNSVVFTLNELTERVRYIHRKYRQPALVEDFIDGRELHVSLWENGSIDMLPPAEMEFSSFLDEHDRICDYAAKFIPESEGYQKIKTLLPAPLTETETARLEAVCKKAYKAAGCRDYARIDIRLKNGVAYVIDINPNADISPDTSTIAAAEMAGYSYGEFGSRLISLAARRHPIWGENLEAGEAEMSTDATGAEYI